MNRFRRRNRIVIFWMVIFLAPGLSVRACGNTRFYRIPPEDFRVLHSTINSENPPDLDRSSKVLKAAFSHWSGQRFSESLFLIPAPRTSRVFAMGGTPSEYEAITRAVARMSHVRTARSVCLPPTVLFLTLCGLFFSARRIMRARTMIPA